MHPGLGHLAPPRLVSDAHAPLSQCTAGTRRPEQSPAMIPPHPALHISWNTQVCVSHVRPFHWLGSKALGNQNILASLYHMLFIHKCVLGEVLFHTDTFRALS